MEARGLGADGVCYSISERSSDSRPLLKRGRGNGCLDALWENAGHARVLPRPSRDTAPRAPVLLSRSRHAGSRARAPRLLGRTHTATTVAVDLTVPSPVSPGARRSVRPADRRTAAVRPMIARAVRETELQMHVAVDHEIELTLQPDVCRQYESARIRGRFGPHSRACHAIETIHRGIRIAWHRRC